MSQLPALLLEGVVWLDTIIGQGPVFLSDRPLLSRNQDGRLLETEVQEGKAGSQQGKGCQGGRESETRLLTPQEERAWRGGAGETARRPKKRNKQRPNPRAKNQKKRAKIRNGKCYYWLRYKTSACLVLKNVKQLGIRISYEITSYRTAIFYCKSPYARILYLFLKTLCTGLVLY